MKINNGVRLNIFILLKFENNANGIVTEHYILYDSLN
jgi:hypothetical protein